MGVRPSEAGVKLTFFKADGTVDPNICPVKGEFAYFFSVPRPEAPGDKDPIHGSQDWLTDIIVVDNPIKLVHIAPTQTNIQLTSAASKQVLVRWDVAGRVGTIVNCFTISAGHLGSGRFFAETVQVLDSHTVMDNKHPLWKPWVDAAGQRFTSDVIAPSENQR